MNISNPFFSIIVPVYNTSNTLQLCIDSILKQSFTDFELILVNDGSKDNSGEIVDSFAKNDERIKVIHKQNTGVSDTRNTGINIAKGRYIVFIDSDDRVGDSFLAEYYRILNVSPNALVYQGFISEYSDKNVMEPLPKKSYVGEGIVDALSILEEKRCLGGACNKAFRTDIIQQNNILFDRHFSYGEDKIFTLQYIQYIEETIFSDQCVYFYNRKTEGSLSKKHHKVKELQLFLDKEWFYFNKILEKYPNAYFKQIVNSRYSSFAKYILLSMYRKTENIDRRSREEWRRSIIEFDEQNTRLPKYEIEVPSLINKIYKNDLVMSVLMFLRENFVSLYRFLKK